MQFSQCMCWNIRVLIILCVHLSLADVSVLIFPCSTFPCSTFTNPCSMALNITADSDLQVIDEFISVFRNSVVSLNGASTYDRDVDRDKIYKKWIRNNPHLLQHLALETDCPWLCPTGLPSSEFNPASGIFLTSKWLENVLRAYGKNVSFYDHSDCQ